MKKKWIVIGSVVGILLVGGSVAAAVTTANQEKVKVIPIQDMMGGGWMNEGSYSGMITSDVSQKVYLTDTQVVDEVFVKEGDNVLLGDPLVSYDMTLVNLNLEMKKLNKEGIELNIKKAQREITKLKNAKPAGDGDGGADGDIGFGDDGMGGGEIEEPEEEPSVALAALDENSEPYMGAGTVDDPYHFLIGQEGVVYGSFLNRMAQEQCFFLIEMREGDVSNGALMKLWGQQITEADFHIEPDTKYELRLGQLEENSEDTSDVQAEALLDEESVSQKGWYKGDGSASKPYVFLVTADGVVKGSFFNQMKALGGYFRLEVREGGTGAGILLKAWEQKGEMLGSFEADAEYLVGLENKEPTEEPTPEPTDTPQPTPEPTNPPEPTGEPTNPPEPTGEPTNPPETTGEPTNPPETTGEPTNPPETTGEPTDTQKPTNTQTTSPSQQTGARQSGAANSLVYHKNGASVIPVDTKKDTLDNAMGSVSDGSMSKEEIQKQIKDKETEIRGYQLDLKESDLEIKNIEKELNSQTVRSTINGVVKTVGDPKKPSIDGTPLIQVVSSEGLYIKASVGELQLDDLKVGQQLSGYSYDSGISFTAEVREISPYPSDDEQGRNSSQYPFIAYIPEANGLKNNSYAELTPVSDSSEVASGIIIQKAFVRSQEGEYYVMIDDGEGRLKKQVVTIGKIIWGSSYDISSGLNGDEKIAFPYGKNVKEGAKTEDGTMDELYM